MAQLDAAARLEGGLLGWGLVSDDETTGYDLGEILRRLGTCDTVFRRLHLPLRE